MQNVGIKEAFADFRTEQVDSKNTFTVGFK